MKKLERILLILCIVLYSALFIWNVLHLSHVLADGKYYLHLYGLILQLIWGALFVAGYRYRKQEETAPDAKEEE